MSKALLKQLGDMTLPVEVSRKLHNAQLLVSATDMALALDRLAVAVTAELQDKNPVLLTIAPDGAYLLGVFLQRTVFPLQTLQGAFADEGFVCSGDEPSLSGRRVLIVDSGLTPLSAMQQVVTWLQTRGVSEILRSSVLVTPHPVQADGIAQTLSAVVCEAVAPFGCGIGLNGYCRNLPGLYAAG